MTLLAFRFFCLIFLALMSELPALAQIIPDSSLGTESSRTRSETIKGIESDVIEGGATRRSNLFHSFKEFSIKEGRGAYFANPEAIQNIFTRVTGGNVSNLLGTLGVLGNANLFLINPNGIIFGPNARLEVRGAFIGSTADSLIFDNNFEFSATNPDAPPLLTVNIPIGLRFRESPGNIENRSIADAGSDSSGASGYFGLRVPDGRSLLLVGGDIKADGGGIVAFGGRVELGAVAGAGIVKLNLDDNNLSLNFPDDLPRADVSLTNEADFIVAAGGGGSIAITAKNINILDNSGLYAGILNNLGSSDAQAGDINLNATGEITVADDSLLDNDVESGAVGNAGNININTTDSVKVANSSISSSVNFEAVGNSGNININATEAVTVESGTEGGYSLVGSDVLSEAMGNAGSVTIETKRLSIISSQVTSSTLGKGNAGNLLVRASDSVEISGELPLNSRINDDGEPIGAPGLLSSQVERKGEGQGGNITIETQRLSISDGSKVQVATFGQGNAGNIIIRASKVDVFNTPRLRDYTTGIFATVELDPLTVAPPEGEGGNITIETEQLSIRDGGIVSVSTAGVGNAGNLIVRSKDSVEVVGADEDGPSFLSANVNLGAEGNGGNLTIETGRLSIRNGAQVSASTFGKGNAGDLIVRAADSVEVNGEDEFPSGLFAQVDSKATGDGGNLTIETQRLSVSDGGKVQVSTFNQGNSGDIMIRAADVEVFETPIDNFFLTGIFAEVARSNAKGTGGNLTIETGRLSVRGGVSEVAEVSASTFGEGKAGDLTIRASDSVEVSGGRAGLFAQVNPRAIGTGGNLTIETGRLSIRDGARVSVNTFGTGDAGSLLVRAGNLVEVVGTSATGTPSILRANVTEGATGQGGELIIETKHLLLADGSQITASTQGQGDAGKITITADHLTSTNQSSIQTNTTSSGKAGDILFNINDDLNLNNSTLEASTAPNSTGDGGSISIDPRTVTLTDGARISVNSQGEGDGGDISLTAQNLNLNNRSSISATTASGEGGNITLNVPNTINQRNNSPISATAGGTGNGGNITLKTQFLIGNDNSDITANAFEGTGGNINITADGIFRNPNSEITASSQLGIDGVIETDTPEIDPSRGLINLPQNLVDPNALISQNACRKGSQSEFTVRGRGGLPSTPEEVQSSNEVEVGLVGATELESTKIPVSSTITTRKIIPAQGWRRNLQGEMVLVAYSTADGTNRQLATPANCSSNQ